MPLQDLREPAEPRSRRYHFKKEFVDPELVESVERVFDRDGIVSDVENLLDNHTLQGDEVQTVSDELAPIGAVRYTTQPALRDSLSRIVDNGNGRPSVRPRPQVRFIATVGWPGVYVSPVGIRSARIKRISGPQGGSPGQTASEALTEALTSHVYYLTVDGTRYPIVGLEGTVLELGTDLRFDATTRGVIHNGASKIFMVGEPDSDSAPRVKDKVENEAISRPTPVLSGETLPGPHEISIRTTDRDRSFRQEETVDVQVPAPPEGTVKGIGYRVGSPTGEPENERALNRTMNTLVANVEVNHPSGSAVILGVKYRVATQSDGNWKYGQTEFIPFSARTLRWMLKSEVESDTRSGLLPLGNHSTSHDRRVEITFVDEMGRSAGKQVVDQKAQEGGGFEPHSSLGKRFATLAEQSQKPSEQNVVRFYEKADSKLEPLEAEAESVVKERSLEEVPIEEFQDPIARLNAEVVRGKTVQFSASESGHPNGLDNQYRFDFEGDGSFDTSLGPQETVEHTFDEGGVHVAQLKAIDEIDASNTDSLEVVLPKAKANITFENRNATVDGSPSVADPTYPLEYRVAWYKWENDTQYSTGSRVHYEGAAYEVTGSPSAGLPPIDDAGNLNPGWGAAPWQSSPLASHNYGDDPAGQVYTLSIEVRDARGADDGTTREVYIPDFTSDNLSASADGDTVTVSLDKHLPPENAGITYAFDWDNSGDLDTGYIDTDEQSFRYSNPTTGKTVGVEAQTRLGASSLASTTVYFVNAGLKSASYNPSDNTVSVDASETSATDPDATLEYRFRIAKGEGEFGEWTSWKSSVTRDVAVPPSGSDSTELRKRVIEVEARDGSGGIDRASKEALIVNNNGGTTSNPGKATNITTPGSKIRITGPSGVDPDGYDWEFRVDWKGNGNFSEWTTDNVREKVVTGGGSYNLVFQARTTNPSIAVADREVYEETETIVFPNASFTTTLRGSGVNLDASGSSHPNGETLRYRWDYNNDGQWDTQLNRNAEQSAHRYNQTGTFFIRLEVRGPDGEAATDTASVTIEGRDDILREKYDR